MCPCERSGNFIRIHFGQSSYWPSPAQAARWAGALAVGRTKQFLVIGMSANFIINRSFAFSTAVLRLCSWEQSRRAGFAQSGMVATGCERKVQGISSIKDGHLPLQQRVFWTKRKSGLGFPSLWVFQGKFLLLTPLLGCECFSQQHNFHSRGKGARGALSVLSPWLSRPCCRLSPERSLHLEAAGWRRRQPVTPRFRVPRTLLRCRQYLLVPFIAASPKLWSISKGSE